MLEKDRFLAIKKLAQDVRRKNEGLFKAFKMESPEDAIKEKEEFIETIIDNLEGNFSEGEAGKEEKQIFRANILIPDDEEFLNTYSRDKNIRNLMNIYSVSIEDVMSKITELNIYADYINSEDTRQPTYTQEVTVEPKQSINEETNDDFVDTMVNLSSSDAASLLDEIENLSNVMAEFNISDDYNDDSSFNDSFSNSTATLEEPKFDDFKIPTEIGFDKNNNLEDEIRLERGFDSKENLDYSSDMSIDDISQAVDGFVDDYNNIQVDLDKLKQELRDAREMVEEQKKQIRSLREEAYSLRKNNLEGVKSLKQARVENETLTNENSELKRRVTVLEEQIKRASALLKKIYNNFPRR